MTYEQGGEFFVKEGFQTKMNGERETKRGTSDPTYLYRLPGQGMPPLKLLRRAVLGNDSPVL